MIITIELENGYIIKGRPTKGYETECLNIESITRPNMEVHEKTKDYLGLCDFGRLGLFMREIETETFYEEV